MEDGKSEGGGLAGAGLGDALQVAAGHDARNGLRLDRRGLGIAFIGQRAQQRLGEAEIGELSQTIISHMRRTRRLECIEGAEGRGSLGKRPA